MSCRRRFVPGRVVSFYYPVHNRLGLPLEYRPRRVKVIAVRDLALSPLEAETVAQFPLTRRGRTLIEALDLDIGEVRHFYLEAICGFDQQPGLRIGFFDPASRSAILAGPVFDPTPDDCLAMREAIERCLEGFGGAAGNYQLSVFPVDRLNEGAA